VYLLLGEDGVYYGARFGKKLPWVEKFPFGYFRDPQYVGSILSLFGVSCWVPWRFIALWILVQSISHDLFYPSGNSLVVSPHQFFVSQISLTSSIEHSLFIYKFRTVMLLLSVSFQNVANMLDNLPHNCQLYGYILNFTFRSGKWLQNMGLTCD
jgi:hypothetical protein